MSIRRTYCPGKRHELGRRRRGTTCCRAQWPSPYTRTDTHRQT